MSPLIGIEHFIFSFLRYITSGAMYEKYFVVHLLLQILSDDKKRSAYDQFGQTDFSGAGKCY